MSEINAFLSNWIVQGFFGAFLASLGFGVLFNIRGKQLFLAGLAGAVGGLVYEGLKQYGAPEALANLLGAIALSIISEIFARMEKTTVTTFAICALIPLVPGGTAYQMMVDFAQNNPSKGIKDAVLLITVGLMLALGIILVTNLTRFFVFSKRKIESKAQDLLN